MKKIVISEKQLDMLKNHIKEDSSQGYLIEKIKADLDANYEPLSGVMRQGGEYSETPMIKIKVSNETITPKALFQYLQYKYKLGDEFIKQTIRDWLSGNIKNNMLTKNVSTS